MERKKLPIGIDSFEKLRREDFYYVDKTGLIVDLGILTVTVHSLASKMPMQTVF